MKAIYQIYDSLVNNKRLLLSIPLLLASLFLASHVVPSAHAQFTGKVCITASTTATSCDASPPSLGPFTTGQTFTVGLFVQGSDAMGGWDIYVKSDPTFVNPTSAALGTLVANPSLTSICINGVATTGSCTVGTANGPGVVEATTIESTGTNECGGISPCSGMALTITYSVVGATPTTTLSYPTALGCATSSVSSSPNVCVLIADNVGTVLPETIQGATVGIALPNAVVCVTYPQTATPCTTGQVIIGPVTVGSTYTAGVRIQNSQPMAGFDIYVSVDTNYLIPTSASLGTLVASPDPLLTNICVNDVATTGSCTVNSANGPGVVEVSTAESSGLNECNAAPCSGLAFTVTYMVVHPTPTTPISYPSASACILSSVSSPPNTCVLVANSTGNALSESIQGAMVTHVVFINHTFVGVACTPNPAGVGLTDTSVDATCVATIDDTATSGKVSPISTVAFTTDGIGTFNPSFCFLGQIGTTTSSSCQVSYKPIQVGSGVHHIGAIYLGDSVHSGNTTLSEGRQFSLTVLPASVTVSTQVKVDSTGFPVNVTTGVAQGLSVHDEVIMFHGWQLTGVTGTVTYTLYPNNICTTGTGTVVSTVSVLPANDIVPPSASVAPLAGSYSFQAIFNNVTLNNNRITSACEPFTVTLPPGFTAGKLHWTHHLSLSKSASTQSWTAIVTNPLSTSAKLLVRIVGASTILPTLTFDITCGVTCVTTASGGVNFTSGLTPVSVAAGTSSTSFSFNQLVPGSFVNQKFAFTATVYWTTGTLYTASNSKSGAFAVVP